MQQLTDVYSQIILIQHYIREYKKFKYDSIMQTNYTDKHPSNAINEQLKNPFNETFMLTTAKQRLQREEL